MVRLVELDVDGLVPDDLLQEIDRAEQERALGFRPRQAVHVRSLLDWRRLERRAEQLRLAALAWSKAYWDGLAQAAALKGGNDVWVVDPDDEERVTVYRANDRSTSRRMASELIDDELRNPYRRRADQRPTLLVGDAAALLCRSNERAAAFRLRAGAYVRAFRTAVHYRLHAHGKALLPHSEQHSRWNLRPARLYIVRNEGRCHAVAVDERGNPSWFEEHDSIYLGDDVVNNGHAAPVIPGPSGGPLGPG